MYFGAGDIRRLAADAASSGAFPSDEARRFLAFFAEGKRGFARPSRQAAGAAGTEEPA